MKAVKPKGDRLNWIPVKEYKPVKLTKGTVKGKQVTIVKKYSASAKSNAILVP